MGKKLKPCPFCGGGDVYIDNYDEKRKWALTHYCPHDDCGLSVVITVYGKSEEDVRKKWNKRIIGDK